MKLFLQKKCKIFERWGLRPQTPVPPAAGGFSSKPPLASGGWGLRPQTPKTAPPLRISGYAPEYDHVQLPNIKLILINSENLPFMHALNKEMLLLQCNRVKLKKKNFGNVRYRVWHVSKIKN